jgi:hypothetical protein
LNYITGGRKEQAAGVAGIESGLNLSDNEKRWIASVVQTILAA